jgi:hypothetical protein
METAIKDQGFFYEQQPHHTPKKQVQPSSFMDMGEVQKSLMS